MGLLYNGQNHSSALIRSIPFNDFPIVRKIGMVRWVLTEVGGVVEEVVGLAVIYV